MEIPRPRDELELQLPAYATATAVPDPSRVCNLHHSSQQHQILNLLSKARDQTRNLMGPSNSLTTVPRQELLVLFVFIFYLFFVFLGLHLKHMEVPRLGIKLELQPPAYTTATATQDLSQVCNLHHSSQQHWILNPLSRPGIEPATSWFLVGFINHFAMMGTPRINLIWS